MKNPDQRGVKSRGRGTADFVKYDEESLMPTRPTTADDIGNQSKHKGLLLGGCLIVGYMYLVKLINLKYHGEEKSPFEKNLLMCTYLLTLIAVGIAFAALGYDYGRSLYKKSFSRQVSDGDDVNLLDDIVNQSIVFYLRDDFGNQSIQTGLLLGGYLIVGYMYLLKLVNLMYHGEEKSPFEKNLLMCTYLLTLIAVGIAFAALGYDYGRSLYKKSFSRQVSDGDEVITD